MTKYEGGCLCGETTFRAKSSPMNPHLCSCTTCQASSGAPTVAWTEFDLETFEWSNKNNLAMYSSSEQTQRFFCKKCGSFLGAINNGCANISIVISALKDKNLITPTKQHSYKNSAPPWWKVSIIKTNL